MRLKVTRSIYLIIFLLIVLRLGYWQLIKSDTLTAKAEDQRLTSKQVDAIRGKILFNDRSVLASIQPAFLIYLEPKKIEKEVGANREVLFTYQNKIAETLAEILWESTFEEPKPESTTSALLDPVGKEKVIKQKKESLKQDILEKLNKNLYWVSLAKKVNHETKSKIEKLNLIGVGFEENTSRFYPEGSSSAHLLGFVGSNVYGNEAGYFGLEGFYNGELKGKKGLLTQERDALGLPILIGKFLSKNPEEGKTLVLSLDRSIQYIVEDKLKKGVEKYGAKGGSAILMDPKTGAILAMASYPNYDPVNPGLFPKEYYRNPITADGYEPGSTFKVLVMAAGINENLVKEDTKCDICEGPINLGGFTIRTWNNQYNQDITMTDVIIHSDNTGMVFVAKKLGIDKMFNYLKRFGFGDTTGIDLQDENSPDIRPLNQWREIDLATSSFGQGISVTALQVVRAVAAIANGGKIMEPHVVSQIEENGKVFKIKPRIIDQPIKPESAKTVTNMMVKAVDQGEAKFAKPKGYKIAGKTGTAQIPIKGHYDPNKTIASFVGFAPADDPKFVMLVRYDQPTSSIYGAETAAPTFFDIAKELFVYYGLAPTEDL